MAALQQAAVDAFVVALDRRGDRAALAHASIDRRDWSPIGRSLGINAIAAYAGSWVVVCLLVGSGAMDPLYETVFAGPLTARFGPFVPSLAFALAFTASWWSVMIVLRRRAGESPCKPRGA